MTTPYATSLECQQALAGVEAVDYFFALDLEAECGGDPLRFHLWLALSAALRDGHVCLPLDQVADRVLFAAEEAQGYRFPGSEVIEAALRGLDLSPQGTLPVVRDGDRLYLRRYWQFEQELVAGVRARLQPLPLDEAQLARAREALAALFPAIGTADEPDMQAVAVAAALGQRFFILSGGPGTGKTFTLARLLVALQWMADAPLRIALAAPTGKAAQRMQESVVAALERLSDLPEAVVGTLPRQAMTLHRLLGIHPERLQPRHGRERPLEVDLVVVDEASMVDLPMMVRLLRALPPEARLVLLGDADQLPSVEVGAVLADLAPRPHPGFSDELATQIRTLTGFEVPRGSGADHLCVLSRSRRFDATGGIGLLAARVIGADAQGSWQLLEQQSDEGGPLQLIAPEAWDDWLAQQVRAFYLPLVRAERVEEAFAALNRFRLLLPMRVGPWGVEEANARIEALLARACGRVRPGQPFAGRMVMVTRNNPSLELYNGDVGLVWPNGRGGWDFCIGTGEGIRRVNLGLLSALEPVWAMTIHKTQGSEFDEVAILIGEGSERLLSPELVYTAITRARERCVISSILPLWQKALANRTPRWSGIRARLFGAR